MQGSLAVQQPVARPPWRLVVAVALACLVCESEAIPVNRAARSTSSSRKPTTSYLLINGLKCERRQRRQLGWWPFGGKKDQAAETALPVVQAPTGPCTTAELNINGMTCGHCPPRVKAALEAVPGVLNVEVSLDTRVATVTGHAPPEDLIAAVATLDSFTAELLGARETTTVLTISGMTCSHCAPRVKKALEGVPGVTEVEVSLETKFATITGTAPASALIAAVAELESFTAEVDSSCYNDCCDDRRRRLIAKRTDAHRRQLGFEGEVFSNSFSRERVEYDGHVLAWQQENAPVNDPVEGWLEPWRDQMACWWETNPLRTELESCSAALTEVVATHFDAAKGEAHRSGQQPEPGCEWVSKVSEGLQLPSFPSFRMAPELPVELLPWSVQKWQELGAQSALPQSQRGRAQRAAFSWGAFGIGAAATPVAAAFILVAKRRSRRANRSATANMSR